jgi:TrmH family RNA methyltransferase
MIESSNNERVKFWTKLNDKKYQEEYGLFLVEGEHLVEEAFKAGVLEEVIILKGNSFDYEKQTLVTENVMRKISTLTNVPKIIGVSKKIEPRGIEGKVLLLDRISNPGNLGTIIRSSVAFGVDTVVIGEGSVSIYNPKVLRATEGEIFHINIIEENLVKVINELKEEGYKVFSSKVQGGTSLKNISFPPKCAIVIGSEASGVAKEIENLADVFLYIDMEKACESLNVGVATSIILYELNK